MIRKCPKNAIEFGNNIIPDKKNREVFSSKFSKNSRVLAFVLINYQNLPVKLYGNKILILKSS